MNTKRLFIGTFINHELIKRNYAIIKNDFSPLCIGKWVETENMHFTYKFLGNTDEKIIPEICDDLKGYLTDYNSKLTLKGLGVFPNPKRPRVLFINILDEHNILKSIFDNLENKLIKFGFEKEKRKFRSHITLQRIKYCNNNISDYLEKYSETEFAQIDEFSVNLIESKLTSKGPVYSVIK
jgi:RNA 2',3'-cyclic 3'-phosphodiesterase